MSKVGAWLTANAGVLSVLGALIIFFSWAVTNTLGQRYARMKQSAETAESTFRLYTTLHELRASLNSVAAEAVYTREAAEQGIGKHRELAGVEAEIFHLRRRYRNSRLSAHQIKELMDFASQTRDFSNGVASNTETAERVRTLSDEIYQIYRSVHELDLAAETAIGTPKPALAPLRIAVDGYAAAVSEAVNSKVPTLFQQIVAASNHRRDEGREQLARTKQYSEFAARIALVLYVVGSILALGGQYLDKIYKAKLEAKKAAATSLIGLAPKKGWG